MTRRMIEVLRRELSLSAETHQWRHSLPPWPADQLINQAAHQLYTQPVPDNPEFQAAGCSCGWDSLIVTTEDHQRARFDGHMLGLQVAARTAGPSHLPGTLTRW